MPFWQEVYHTERRAGAIVDAFMPTVRDPVVREAVALQGREETRHAKLIRVMIDRYGIAPDAANRYMIGPYLHYRTEQDLETFHQCATSQEVAAEQYYNCFVIEENTGDEDQPAEKPSGEPNPPADPKQKPSPKGP